jgi:hypothetical protein
MRSKEGLVLPVDTFQEYSVPQPFQECSLFDMPSRQTSDNKKGVLNFHRVSLNAQACTFGSREILKKRAHIQPGEGFMDLFYTSLSKSACYFEVYSVDIRTGLAT